MLLEDQHGDDEEGGEGPGGAEKHGDDPAEEADAIRKSSTAYTDYAAGTDNVAQKIVAYTLSLFSQTHYRFT